MEMYNLESEFKKFYAEHVVLPQSEKNALFNKKNINVERLKEGLVEYNEEHGTDYKLAEEPIVQGSVAMSTVIQNDSNDYDIDVAIVFEKGKIPEGTTATKNMVVDALKRKTKQFKVEPEAKTNCIRIVYAEGYHVDFAIYRRYKDGDVYKYEHCGSEWRERDPRSITKWFFDQNKEKEYKLREVIRLLKMFSKSRDGWVNMPGGLIQSVLCDECDEQFQSYERLDERFYYIIEAIKNRLALNKDVFDPVDPNKSLTLVQKDRVKIENLYNRLSDKLSKLSILFDKSCTYKKAIEAWEEFFNHEYWTEQKQMERLHVPKPLASYKSEDFILYRETEEFIENLFPVKIQYKLNLDCKVYKDGKAIGWLRSMAKRREPLLPNHILIFKAEPINIPSPYKVYWKVRNRGEVAKKKDLVRGEVVETNELLHKEHTQFKGNHYVECYIVKDGVCVARQRINVPIKVL